MDTKQASRDEAALEQRISQIKDHFAARVEELERRATSIRDRLDARKVVQRHPWRSVGLSLAAGLVVGLVAGRRSRHAHSQGASMPMPGKQRSVFASLLGAVVTAALTRVAREGVERLAGRILDHNEKDDNKASQRWIPLR